MTVTTDDEKIAALQNIIREHANSQRAALVADARSQAEKWISGEMAKLDKEADAIIADAQKQADDIARRRLLAAERERASEALKLQNAMLQEAMRRYLDGLAALRDQDDYAEIIASLAVSTARELDGAGPLTLRLAAADHSLGDSTASIVRERVPNVDITFSPDPAPILGGCWISSNDGRRQAMADWQSMAREASDAVASRLLELL